MINWWGFEVCFLVLKIRWLGYRYRYRSRRELAAVMISLFPFLLFAYLTFPYHIDRERDILA